MKNSIFELEFNKEKGILTSLVAVGDKENANFIKPGRGLCEIHATPWYGRPEPNIFSKAQEAWNPCEFSEAESSAVAVFERRGVVATQTFTLTEQDLRITIDIKNTNFFPMYFQKESFSLYTPFADSYDDSITCQRVRCHTHMAPFYDNSYVRTERMGISKYNVDYFS